MRFLTLAAAAVLPSLLLGAGVAAPTALQAQVTTVVIVRHGEKAAAPANDPVLSEAGQARASALATALAGANVQAVIVTPFQRTQLTAAPTATARGLTPQVVAISPTHVADVAKAVREHKGKVVLVVGHSNTVPAIVNALGGPKLPDLCDAEYAQLFTLVLQEQGPTVLVRGIYGAPDAPTAGDCARPMSR
jgi:broad specificity phosphatase PhoE